MITREPPGAAQSGFTIVELLASMAITLAVFGAVFAVLNPAQGTFQVQPEVSDMQQRLRVAIDALNSDLVMAGAGLYSGPTTRAGGALTSFFAPVMPYRSGALHADPPGTFKTDTISLLYIPETAAQTTIRAAISPAASVLEVNGEPGCPADPLCGFKQGMQVLVFDGTGARDLFVVTDAQGSVGHLQRCGPDSLHSYDPGSFVVQAIAATYYLKSDDATQTYQLARYDGRVTEAPVADNIVGLSFGYLGDPQPPALRRPVSDSAGPWTTYGPKPPALGVDPGSGYPAGENCAFAVADGQQVPRLADLSPGATALVPLPAAMLTDGPWCPSPTSAARYDADLLRIREIRVKVRVQAGPSLLRGRGALFAKPGYARGGETFVPDQELQFDVVPRNLNLLR